MKKFYLNLTIVLFIIAAVDLSRAQSVLWGLNPGGESGLGVLYSIPTGSTVVSSRYNFTGNSGANPQYAKLLQASNGKLYGTTSQGGSNNLGVLFEFDTLTNTFTHKFDFQGPNGSGPRGSLIQAANGKLYGMTQQGGLNNQGVIFEYDILMNTQQVLVHFSGVSAPSPGGQPIGTLIQPDPLVTKLYGVTRMGGANDRGVVFEYDYTTNVYTRKQDFDGNTGLALGSAPHGQLIKAVSASSSSTTLYGLSSSGGTNNAGTLFEYDYALDVLTKKIDLTSTTGSNPQGSLFLASNGILYGTTTAGGTSAGVIFEYHINTNTYNRIHNFTNGAGSTGGITYCELAEVSAGKLYGLTRLGGATNAGVIFELDVTNPLSPVYTKRVDLVTANGSLSFGSLMLASTGKLYGMTSAGGAAAGGVIFRYQVSNNTYTKLVDLNFSAGANPQGGLVHASNDKLYGLAVAGGTVNNLGVLFEYDKTTGVYTKRVDFSGITGTRPGSSPYGSLMQASNARLYGMTSAGGSSNVGTLFSYDITNGTFTKHVDFTGNAGVSPGSGPYGTLVEFTGSGTANGKLYGMTKQGGSSNQGVIFEFNPSTNTYAKKLDLSLASANGYSAFGAMVESSDKLYGMTQLGGANGQGVIFEYDPNTNVYTKKVDFSGTSGSTQGGQPWGSLVKTSTVGVLYGMTRQGGANNAGVIFEYNVLTNTYVKKWDMSTVTGSEPWGSLVLAANGKLYGVTSAGGANNAGVLFEYDIATGSYVKKMDFGGVAGKSPAYTHLLEVCNRPMIPGSITASNSAICYSATTAQNFSINAVTNADTYAWTLPSGATITSGTTSPYITANLAGLSVGTYTYGVAGVNICGTGSLSTAQFTVNALPTVSVNSGSVCAGSVFTIVPSGAATYTIQGNSFTVSPLSTSSYTVIGRNAAGCLSSNTAVATVTALTLPVIGVSDATICAGQSVTLVPTGVLTSTPSGGSLIVAPSTSTFYTITGSDANNCVSANTATAHITVNASPVIAVSDATACAGVSATLSPSGAGVGGTYTSGSLNGPGPFVVNPSITTTYTFSGTNAAGCVSANTPTATVHMNASPVVSVNNPTVCSGRSTTIIPTGAGTSGTYTLFLGSVPVVNGPGPFMFNPSSSVSYTIAGTNTAGCLSSNTATTTVSVFNLPTVTVNSGSACAGTAYTFTPNGAASYTMTGGVTGNTFVVSPVTSTSYTIAGTSTAGCVSSFPATANLTVYALPNLTVNSGTLCYGESFTVTPLGGTQYTIMPGNITTSSSVALSPTITSSYSVTGENALGCLSSAPVIASLSVHALPVLTVSDGTICIGDTYTSSVSGAVSYTYASATSTIMAPGSATFSPSFTEVYWVSGTANDGCVSAPSHTMILTVNPLPLVTITGTNALCTGDAVTLTAGGANTYNWGSSTGASLVDSPTAPTVYTVTGTDLNNCSETATFSVTVYSLPTITAVSAALCPGDSYTIVPSGADTYTYSGGSQIVSPAVTTDYTITGTSQEGCVSQTPAVITVSVVNILTVSISGNTVVCAGETVNLTASGANTYTWSTGATGHLLSLTPANSGSYSVIGGSGACSDITSVTVVVNNLPLVSASADRTLICVGEEAVLTAGGASSYSWTTAQTGAQITVSPLVSTVYTVTGLSSEGCENKATVSLSIDACLGITRHQSTWQYGVYPNPNAGQFVVETSSVVTMIISNSLGQIISSQQIQEGKTPVQLNDQAKGIYFVQLKNGTSSKIIKVVKQ